MKKVTQAIIKKIKKVASEKPVTTKEAPAKYSCLNCEDSGMDCYVCKAA